ncbi:hypothetical protein E2320_003830 [Naja naja]|nr:hypothetical protein E2320_003830 [Naja naja]
MSTMPAFPCSHPMTETWDSYINHFDCFLDATDLTEISAIISLVFVALQSLILAQAERESISSHMAALCTAALHCGFRDHLDDMLLDQLVCGMWDLRLQLCHLVKTDFTLKMAIEEAQAAELSTLSAAEIQGYICLPAAKAAIHYDDIQFECIQNNEDDIHCLRTQQQPQQKN